MPRISFNEHDIAHLYELALEHFCVEEECWQCLNIKKRIEKFIGVKEVNRIKRIIKKNGYCKHKIVLNTMGGCFCERCHHWSNMPDGLQGEECEYERPDPDTNDPSQFPACGEDLSNY